MRFNRPPKPKLRDLREVRRFLIFPTRIENETRWMEMATIKQEYSSWFTSDSHGTYEVSGWCNLEWVG